MSVISSMAATTRSFRVFRVLLAEARRHGRPSVIDYVTYLQIWLIPPDLRHRLRDRVLNRRRGGQPSLPDARRADAVPGTQRAAHAEPVPSVVGEPDPVAGAGRQ